MTKGYLVGDLSYDSEWGNIRGLDNIHIFSSREEAEREVLDRFSVKVNRNWLGLVEVGILITVEQNSISIPLPDDGPVTIPFDEIGENGENLYSTRFYFEGIHPVYEEDPRGRAYDHVVKGYTYD